MARPLSPTARSKILKAAQDVIVRLGLDACTVDEVARRSGVAKTTIYRHFTNTDGLIFTAVDQMKGEAVTPDTGAFATDLKAMVMAFRGILQHESARRMWVSMLSRSIEDPEFEEVYARSQEVRHAPLKRVLQRAIARGEVDPEIDIEQAMYFVQGPFVAKRLVEVADLTEDDIDVFIDLICRALAPR